MDPEDTEMDLRRMQTTEKC